jgi:hypothetical protein
VGVGQVQKAADALAQSQKAGDKEAENRKAIESVRMADCAACCCGMLQYCAFSFACVRWEKVARDSGYGPLHELGW